MKCVECGKEFTANRKGHKFCGVLCRGRHHSNAYNRRNREKVNAIRRQRYWKDPEKERAYSRSYPKPEDRAEKTCIQCGATFTPLSPRHPYQKFCGRRCGSISMNKKMYAKYTDRKIAGVLRARNRSAASKQAHSDRAKTYGVKRRGYIHQGGYNLLPKDFDAVRERDGHQCVYCGCKATKEKPLTFDHIIPLKKRGLHIKENLVVSCYKCNSSKGIKEVVGWCEIRGIAVPTKVQELLKAQESFCAG